MKDWTDEQVHRFIEQMDRAHRLCCSDPDDPTRATTYSDARDALRHLLDQRDTAIAYQPEVVAEVAVNLGEHESWDRLADWCGGRIVNDQDPSGEYTSTLILPNGESGGDWAWLVLDHAGDFHIRTEVRAPTPGTMVPVAAAQALVDEWDSTVYKLPFLHHLTVNEFCEQWFKAPLRALVARSTARSER